MMLGVKVRAEARMTGRRVAVGPGLTMPATVTVTAEDVHGYDVEVVVAAETVAEHGRLVAREVRIRQRDGGPPVTGEAIRAVPVAALTHYAATHLWVAEQKGGHVEEKLLRMNDELAARLREAGPTTETLKWVAHLYRVGLLTGSPPTVGVEQTLNVPRSTAGRWVAMARRRGFLGAAEGPGKAGG
jgi:hypothetical protein